MVNIVSQRLLIKGLTIIASIVTASLEKITSGGIILMRVTGTYEVSRQRLTAYIIRVETSVFVLVE